MALNGRTDEERFQDLQTRTYKEQAIWFLNAFWVDFEGEAERLWQYVSKMSELDLQKGKNGNALDELNAHRFLESFNETMTVRQMRDTLRESGAIGASEKPKYVPLIHYLIFRFRVNWKTLINASQGDNKAEIEEAQRMLEAVQAAFREAENKAQAAAQALREAEAAEADAKRREAEAYASEAEARQAREELEAALAELKAQEDAYNNKTADLTKRSEEGGVVSRNKAKAELAQHLAEDPLPLRKAKITQEAAVKKAERTRLAAEEAARQASAARAQAEESREASARAKAAAEAALDEARAKVDEAEAYLNEVKRKPGQAQGAIWWIERELHEAKAYLPVSKGGYQRK